MSAETLTIKGGGMRRFKIGAAAIGFIIGAALAAPATAWDRGRVDVLTVLPDVTPGVQSSVEGLTVGPDDNIYVPTFGFNTHGAISGNANAKRKQGSLTARTPIREGSQTAELSGSRR
jgi:hypothetical protein